jgi:hypothetical protein
MRCYSIHTRGITGKMDPIPKQDNTNGFNCDAAQGKIIPIPQQHSISGFDYTHPRAR